MFLPHSAESRTTHNRGVARHFLVLALLLLLFPGCSIFKKGQEKRRLAAQKERAAARKIPKLVGTIVLVSEEGKFVLIDNESRPSPAMGTILGTGGEGPSTPETVELRVTEIRKRPFVIADIVRGQPQKGDRVFE
jgi:hypothetical protein